MNYYEKLKKAQESIRERVKNTFVLSEKPEDEDFDPFRPHVSGKGSEYLPLWRRITSETDDGYNLPRDVNDCVYSPASSTLPNPRYDPRLGFFERHEIERESQAIEAANLTPSQQALRRSVLDRVDDGVEIEAELLQQQDLTPAPAPAPTSSPEPNTD